MKITSSPNTIELNERQYKFLLDHLTEEYPGDSSGLQILTDEEVEKDKQFMKQFTS